jgi:phytoene desaturase
MSPANLESSVSLASRAHAIVVGAGVAGLTVAMLLQTKGFQVTVLEKRDRLGGRCGGLQLGPYTFDVGATMLANRTALDETFALAGRRRSDEVTLVPVDPMYRVDFGGDAIAIRTDDLAMENELRRFAAGAGESVLRSFLAQESEGFARLYPVLRRTWPAVAERAARSAFEAAGSSRAPTWGVDHVEGGLHRIPEAFARVAETAGATLRRGATVRRIVVEEGRARAVELDDGVLLRGDIIIVNADATHALLALLGDAAAVRFSRRELTHRSESLSAYSLYLGLDVVPPLGHHTFFAGAIAGTADDLPLYVCNPVVTDPTMAPPGHAALHLVALVPNSRDASIDWTAEAPRMRERILDFVSRRTGFDAHSHVRAEARMTPADWEERFAISHGAVFGPEAQLEPGLAFRVPFRLSSPDNVYLTGGGERPAAGLPATLEAGRVVAGLVCEAEGIAVPSLHAH